MFPDLISRGEVGRLVGLQVYASFSYLSLVSRLEISGGVCAAEPRPGQNPDFVSVAERSLTETEAARC